VLPPTSKVSVYDRSQDSFHPVDQLIVAADDVPLLVIPGKWIERRTRIHAGEADQVERGLITGVTAILRDRIGNHQLSEQRGAADRRLVEPLRC
jgi:hypothetical protein